MHRYNGEHHADPGEITPELHDVIDDITQSQMEEMLCSLPSRCFVMWVSKAGRYKTRLRVCDIALSSAPEVTSSYVTTWVRVGVNRAQALYDTVVSSGFHTLLFVSIEFWTMHSAYFSRFLYASVRFRLLL